MKFLSLTVGISHQLLAQQPLPVNQGNLDQQKDEFEFEARQLMHKASIEALLAEHGAYGHGLDEAYTEFGKLHLENGNYIEAANLFRQAWHLNRITTGLYDDAQLTHLNLLIEALIQLRQWDEVHDLHHLSFLIASRAYPPSDIRYVLAAEFYTSWQWEAINGEIFSRGSATTFEMAQQLSALYEEIIDRIEHGESEHTVGLSKLILAKAHTDISIARTLVNTDLTNGISGPGRFITETYCFDKKTEANQPARYCKQMTLPNPDIYAGTLTATRFALGRYLKQIAQSIDRLERLRKLADSAGSTEQNSQDEIAWINQVIGVLERESQTLFTSARPT